MAGLILSVALDVLNQPGLTVQQHELVDGPAGGALLSTCGRYRYALTRQWAPGNLAAFVMLNPSTADASEDDATIRRCIGFARSWGAGGLLVLNLFALRSTDPAQLLDDADPVGPANDATLAHFLAGHDGKTVAAWGGHPAAEARSRQVAGMLARPLLCLGTTKDGFPRHPSRLPKNTALVPFTNKTDER